MSPEITADPDETVEVVQIESTKASEAVITLPLRVISQVVQTRAARGAPGDYVEVQAEMNGHPLTFHILGSGKIPSDTVQVQRPLLKMLTTLRK